ncbi:MAG TPA: hypothetical protein VGR31_14530 [Planctomycetota bacterium]|jgi:hypothetical protein|nr:hypothetical protein [Planctomycetota bacterium]
MPGTAPIREEILEPLRRTLVWLAAHRDREGRILCREHAVEHTGKSAYAIVSALELLALDPARDADFLRELAVGQARRLVANLVREGDSPCHTFRPGWHDPFNCSNSIIDGGAASDALAEIVRRLGPTLAPEERERFLAASVLHARTYLRYAVLDKGIPAQRAWGLTGLAAAAALSGDADLERASIEAIGALEAIQHADGSYPYHPVEWGAEHAGESDVSAFYQSRITGFLFHALALLGRDPADPLFRGPLARGLEFLLALQAPDGTKCGLVEAKPWYWGAEYEVASHPFDVHALAKGWRLDGRERFADAAVRSFRAWAAHLLPDGEPRSHLPASGRGRSYQCPLFWSAHAAWILRAAVDLEAAFAREGAAAPAPSASGSIDLRVQWFPQAELGRLEDGRTIAWVRGKRPGVNVHHGSPRGAGLLRVFDKRTGRDVLDRGAGEWVGTAGAFSPARGWRSGSSELRFSLWLARVHARAGRFGAALRAPGRVFRDGVIAFASPRVGSAFDLAPEVDVLEDGVLLRSALAHRDGSRAPGSALVRRFRLEGDGLAVEEHVESDGAARSVDFRFPRGARDVVREGPRASYRIP